MVMEGYRLERRGSPPSSLQVLAQIAVSKGMEKWIQSVLCLLSDTVNVLQWNMCMATNHTRCEPNIRKSGIPCKLLGYLLVPSHSGWRGDLRDQGREVAPFRMREGEKRGRSGYVHEGKVLAMHFGACALPLKHKMHT